MPDQKVIRILNVVSLVVFGVLIVWLVADQGCHTVSNRPNDSISTSKVDVEHVLRQINGLNVLTNLLVAVPGIMLLLMGLPLEGGMLLLCTGMSCMWHASGWKSVGVLDQIVASFTCFTALLIFFRICQVRGYPEFTAFYLTLPAAGVLMLLAGSADFVTNDGSCKPSGSTMYITNRISHSLWHVISGALFFILTIELLRTPDLLPNRRLAGTVHTRDAKMRMRTWRTRGDFSKGPSATIIGGLLADIFTDARETHLLQKQ